MKIKKNTYNHLLKRIKFKNSDLINTYFCQALFQCQWRLPTEYNLNPRIPAEGKNWHTDHIITEIIFFKLFFSLISSLNNDKTHKRCDECIHILYSWAFFLHSCMRTIHKLFVQTGTTKTCWFGRCCRYFLYQ